MRLCMRKYLKTVKSRLTDQHYALTMTTFQIKNKIGLAMGGDLTNSQVTIEDIRKNNRVLGRGTFKDIRQFHNLHARIKITQDSNIII